MHAWYIASYGTYSEGIQTGYIAMHVYVGCHQTIMKSLRSIDHMHACMP